MRPRLYNIAHSSRFSQMGHRGEFGRPPIEAALIIPDALATPTFKLSHGRFGNRVGHDLADVHHKRERLIAQPASSCCAMVSLTAPQSCVIRLSYANRFTQGVMRPST